MPDPRPKTTDADFHRMIAGKPRLQFNERDIAFLRHLSAQRLVIGGKLRLRPAARLVGRHIAGRPTPAERLVDVRHADPKQRRGRDHGDVEDGPASGGARTKNVAEKIAALGEKRRRYDAMVAQLERTGEDQISLTDPDSRAMAAHTKVGVGYNIQVAVDAKHKLIVEQAVTNQVVDMGLLTQTAEPAREILDVETIDVVADRGYFKIEDIEACEKAGCIPHVPRPQRGSSVRDGFFRKDEFRYDAGRDAYVCPAGKVLTPIRHGRLRDLAKVDYGNAQRDSSHRCACTARPVRLGSGRLERQVNPDAISSFGQGMRP